MLTKKDLQQVEQIVERSIKIAFEDFYDHIFEPYANRMDDKFNQNHEEIKEKISLIDEHLLNHERRIIKLEVINKI